ncbi:MAG: PAAR domain-containing protein [Desulfobacteraceae bacterium]|jgi:hypothetical protein
MPGGARIGDKARAIDAHGCKVCSHIVIGPAVQGSSDVIINGKPAVRQGDGGIHGICCGTNTWHAGGGSTTVFINGKPAYRLKDTSVHCGGRGQQIGGSSDVIIGDSLSGGFKKAAKNRAPFVCNCNQ